jgi:transglutaminase-like putative cysteine protease
LLLEVRHSLHFTYDDFVRESQMALRVEPSTSPHQNVQAFHLAVGPPAAVHRYRDWNGNAVHHLGIREYHDRIEVEARSVVEVSEESTGLEALDALPVSPGALLDFALPHGPTAGGRRLADLAGTVAAPTDAPVGVQLRAVDDAVRGALRYVSGSTSWRSTAEEALEVGSGVCQDFAHVTLALLRRRGIPARYVSGYLHVGETAEPAQSHAWIEVYGAGRWVEYDPTSSRTPDAHYVRVATGRHYHDVPPNRGVYRGAAEEQLEASVETREIAPRDVATLQRSTADLEVPVYSEPPRPAHARRPLVEEQPPDPAEQQQQQQQQQ